MPSEIESGVLDTTKVKVFEVPAGVLVEAYATTLHYAPCHCDPGKGFWVLKALPQGPNTGKPAILTKSSKDKQLWVRNKWLLAHLDSSEAKQGTDNCLSGQSIHITNLV